MSDQERKEYNKKYYRDNKERLLKKMKEYNNTSDKRQSYYQKNIEKLRQRSRDRYRAEKDGKKLPRVEYPTKLNSIEFCLEKIKLLNEL